MKRFRPIEFEGWELSAMRFLFAIVVYVSISTVVHEVSQPAPVGLARFWDFTFMADKQAMNWCRAVVAAGLVFYVVGRFVGPALLVVSFLVLGYGALKNSQAALAGHSMQIVGLVLLAQTVYYVWHAVRAWIKRGTPGLPSMLDIHRGAAWIAMQTAVATYVVTAISKLYLSELSWLRNAKYFPVQLVKAQKSEYYNTLEAPVVGDGIMDQMVANLSVWFMESPMICRTFLGTGLVLELVAFLALWGRKSALAYGLMLVVFHLTISRVMSLTFDLNIYVLLIFLVNLPYWGGRVFMRR